MTSLKKAFGSSRTTQVSGQVPKSMTTPRDWLNLDVSPNGTHFSGDLILIYRIPSDSTLNSWGCHDVDDYHITWLPTKSIKILHVFSNEKDVVLKSFECGSSLEHHGVYSLDPSRKGVLPWSSSTSIGILASLRADAADTIVRSCWHTVLLHVCMDMRYPGCIRLLAPVSPANFTNKCSWNAKDEKGKKHWTIWSWHIKIHISSDPLSSFWYSRLQCCTHVVNTLMQTQ